jgi:hypothetical protein
MPRSAHVSRTNPPIGPCRLQGFFLAACAGVASSLAASPPLDESARFRAIAGIHEDREKQVEPIRVGDLIVWNMGSGLHAVRLADGEAPWKDLSQPRDSLLFPRGVAAARLRKAAAADPPPLAACSSAARAIAILDGISATDDDVDAAALVCLDLSPAAEGRLAWIAPPPAVVVDSVPPRPTAFDGPPAADAGQVYCVVRSREPADWLHLAAYDLRDGHVTWTRPLGSAIAADGIDHAPRGRRARCEGGLVTVDTRAGTVATFDRSGRAINTLSTGARP